MRTFAARFWCALGSGAISLRIRAEISNPHFSATAEPNPLLGPEGPLWYRGYFRAPRATDAELKAALAALGANKVVVGHSIVDQVQTLYGGRVVAIDVTFENPERAQGLVFDNGRLMRALMDGSRTGL